MKKHWLSAVILVVMVLAAVVPILLAPTQAEATPGGTGTWMVYTPNHPLGCAPLAWDCYVIFVAPDDP